MKLSVPYYSQFVDIQDSFWMLRACGGLCLKMVAEYHLSVDNLSNEDGKVVPCILELCNEAKERGGYDMQNGWVHDYLVTKAQELGLQAYRKEGITSLEEIYASLDAGNPVIVSVEKRVLEQTRFHLVVLTGFEQHADSRRLDADLADNTNGIVQELAISYQLPTTSCLYYHETESTDKEKGKFRSCDESTFLQYFRGKAIFITK